MLNEKSEKIWLSFKTQKFISPQDTPKVVGTKHFKLKIQCLSFIQLYIIQKKKK